MTPGGPLRSGRARRPEPERLAHPAVLGVDASEPDAAARCRAPRAGHHVLGVLPAALVTADNPDRATAPGDERPAALLSGRTRGPRRPRVRDAEVPHAPARRRGPTRPIPRRGARPPYARGDDRGRRVVALNAARRGSSAPERAARRHEPRRAAPDPATVLRGARGRATGVLAAPRRQAGVDGLRPGAARLRDLDGGEARSRPGMDRGPLGAALPADARHDGRPRLAAIRARPPRALAVAESAPQTSRRASSRSRSRRTRFATSPLMTPSRPSC